MERLTPVLHAGNFARCESEVIAQLLQIPDSPFHRVIPLNFSNDAETAAEHFDRFFAQEARRFKIGAAYTEMNGFAINPDRWYCDLFAYQQYGGHDDYDWLAHWQSAPFEELELTGMEKLQEVYACDAFQEPAFSDACDMCGLLVIIKFQRFVWQAAQWMRGLCFPLLSTAHDYDFIAEVTPIGGKRIR